MKSLVMFVLVLLFAVPCFGQELYEPYSQRGGYRRFDALYRLQALASRYETTPPRLYSGGRFIGELSEDRYAPDSVSNPYDRFGSRYSPDSVNNPYGPNGKYSARPIYVYPSR